MVRQAFRTVRRDDWTAQLMLVMAVGGYLTFVALYGYRYRDFATMKAIFICPAALALLTSFAASSNGPAVKDAQSTQGRVRQLVAALRSVHSRMSARWWTGSSARRR